MLIYPDVSERTILGRALRCPLKLIPYSAQMRILAGPLRGKKWIAGSSLHRCWLGYYEVKKQKEFWMAIKSGDVVYDLGANVGLYSLLASSRGGRQGRVFSFEPVPRNLYFLRMHLSLNDIANCSVLEVAVGASNEFANFDAGPSPLMGRLVRESQGAFRVRVVALDSLVATGEIPPPDVIKCDIEGAEYNALAGASGILAKYRPTIFLETHGPETRESCCKLLADLDYKLSSVDGLALSQTNEILAIGREDCQAVRLQSRALDNGAIDDGHA